MKNIKFRIPFRTGDVAALTEEGAVEGGWSATAAGEHIGEHHGKHNVCNR